VLEQLELHGRASYQWPAASWTESSRFCHDAAVLRARPEAAFVMALARGDLARCAAIPAAVLDPERIEQLAARHEVDALCWWMSQGGQAFAWPSESLGARFRLRFLFHLLRNESLLGDLDHVARALSARGVEALFLKGPWLAASAYPSPGCRPVSDIDLCIREACYEPALRALGDAGYRPLSELPATGARALERAHYGAQLRFSASGRRPLELHFRLVNVGPPSPDEEWVWRTSRALAVAGGEIRVPGPEAMLLHLSIHAAQHGFANLRLAHDIRWALERDGARIDPALLLDAIAALRFGATAYRSLALALEQAGARSERLPLAELRPGVVRRQLGEWLWRLPAARALESRPRATRLEAPRLFLLGMGRARDKLRYVAGIAREAGGLLPLLRAAVRPIATT
jgi:putative nucleotidyltransferase-like protein